MYTQQAHYVKTTSTRCQSYVTTNILCYSITNYTTNVVGTHLKLVYSEVSCQSSICLHDVTGTHLESLVNRLFFSFVSWVLIENALTIAI